MNLKFSELDNSSPELKSQGESCRFPIKDNSTQRLCYMVGLYLAIFLLCLCIVLLSLVPPISRDALVHHLAIPKLYLENGSFFPFPCMSYSYFPMNLDLLYMVALYLGSDIAPKLLHFSFSLMTAVLIYKYLRKSLDSTWGLGGAFLFLSIPIIIKLSVTVYVDLGLMFFSTTALLVLFKWIKSNFKVKYLLLAGVCSGMAMGTKYNGLIVFFLLTCFVPFIYSRFKNGSPKYCLKALVSGLIFALTAMAVFSPWMVRNYIWTKNPIYPLYGNYFNVQMDPKCIINSKSQEFIQFAEGKISFGRFAYRKFVYGEKWWETASLPIRIFFQGKDNDFQLFDGKLSILLLLLPLFSFVSIPGSIDSYKYEKKILASFSVLFILFAIFGSVVRIRYLAPVVPCLVILSVYALKNITFLLRHTRFKSIKREISCGFWVLLLIYFAWFHGGYVLEQFKYIKPFSYLSGNVSRDAYISSYRYEYPAFQYINEKLSSDAKILFFYVGKRGYYCNREYFPDEGRNIKLLYGLINTVSSPWEIRDELHKLGITHLMINNSLFKERIFSDIKDEDKKNLFLDFIINWTEMKFDEKGFSIYELKKSP